MKMTSTAVTSACIGVAVGTAAYMLSGGGSKRMRNKTRRLRKNTGRALRQAGDFLGSMGAMVR